MSGLPVEASVTINSEEIEGVTMSRPDNAEPGIQLPGSGLPPVKEAPTARTELTELAKIGAVRAVLDEREATIRESLKARAQQVAEQTGATPRLAAKGLGMCYITEPAEHAAVTNDIEWAEWCKANHPDRTSTRAAFNVAVLKAIADKDLVFTRWLIDQGVITEEIILEDGLTDELARTLARSAAGGLVDPKTGEVLPVVVEKGRRPQFTVKIDAAAKERFVAEVRESLDLNLIGAPKGTPSE